MKRAICSFGILITLGLQAATPPNPLAAPPTPGAPGLPASPANPTLPATPASPGFSGQTSAAGGTNSVTGLPFTNQFNTLAPAELSSALVVLQNNLQQTLNLLAAFDASLSALPVGAGANATPATAPAANLGQNFAGNAAANLA